MQIDLERANRGNVNGSSHGSQQKAKPLKLPMFVEDKDDLNAYLERFERYARSRKCHESDSGINLSTLLTGKAIVVYITLPSEEANDYSKLKKAILKKHKLTEIKICKTRKQRNCCPVHDKII